MRLYYAYRASPATNATYFHRTYHPTLDTAGPGFLSCLFNTTSIPACWFPNYLLPYTVISRTVILRNHCCLYILNKLAYRIVPFCLFPDCHAHLFLRHNSPACVHSTVDTPGLQPYIYRTCGRTALRFRDDSLPAVLRHGIHLHRLPAHHYAAPTPLRLLVRIPI